MMDTSINFHNVAKVEAQSRNQASWLRVEAENGDYIAMHMPRHVNEHVAEAFNRAMQAVPEGSGYRYETANDIWHISVDLAMGKVWLAQNDEVTGDGDPSWMFADGKSLIGVMDAIDAIVEGHSCTRCGELVGDEHLTQTGGAEYLCDTCHDDMNSREEAMREMADDDKAHAMRDIQRGL